MAKYLKQSGHTYREKEREIDGIQCSNNNETSDKGQKDVCYCFLATPKAEVVEPHVR